MSEERLAEFSRERLGGRPVPDDLRVLLTEHWEGRTDLLHLLDLQFLEPGDVHPMLDESYLREEERADISMIAVRAASSAVAEHLHIVARHGKGWVGYWTHPDEPADKPVPLIELDTEFTFWGMEGRSLAEACAADMVRLYDDEEDPKEHFARLADTLIEHGVPMSTRDYEEVYEPEIAVDPEELHDEINDAEFERLRNEQDAAGRG
ncbi:hypothetical protein ACFOVU_23825 [Nocardiopsis sediminis]|uniref:Uncharacterized protein n=1 Tax=Nocardiopsis sediminis TaxID=1778267 RepID=A0ABV8FW62_9ACTN